MTFISDFQIFYFLLKWNKKATGTWSWVFPFPHVGWALINYFSLGAGLCLVEPNLLCIFQNGNFLSWNYQGVFLGASCWGPGGAHGSEIHKTEKAALRLGPQEVSSFKLVYTQSQTVSQLPFGFCCHLLAPGAVSSPSELWFCFLLPLQFFGQWFACYLSSLTIKEDLLIFSLLRLLLVRIGLMTFMVFTCLTKHQKYLCSLFNSCNLLSLLLYRNYSKVNNK